jgi:hypothetical protein
MPNSPFLVTLDQNMASFRWAFGVKAYSMLQQNDPNLIQNKKRKGGKPIVPTDGLSRLPTCNA